MIKLEYYRNKAGLSQCDLARKVNMTQQRISSYERGIREPDLETLKVFADFFGITTDELLGIEISPKTNDNNIQDNDIDIAFYEGYKDLDEDDKEVMRSTLEAFLKKNKKK